MEYKVISIDIENKTMTISMNNTTYTIRLPFKGEDIDDLVYKETREYFVPEIGYTGKAEQHITFQDGYNTWTTELASYKLEVLKSMVRMIVDEINDELI